MASRVLLPCSRSAIKAILTFASAQGTTVVAEGVETQLQRSILRELGISLGQGYLLGRPARQVREVSDITRDLVGMGVDAVTGLSLDQRAWRR